MLALLKSATKSLPLTLPLCDDEDVTFDVPFKLFCWLKKFLLLF